MNESNITLELIEGSIESRTWFEANLQPCGDLLLTGKGCTIHRRKDGSIRDVKFSDTGVKMTIPKN